MILKEVRINGFKSFADQTIISLDQGITCVIGPNGCGKSNIVDAIRWVLGEQSAKSLRGSKMQDVIFQGASSRKALQMCSVTLKFTDCEKELGTSFNEIEITRQASRDGGSSYRLNGKTCRLKDIQNLFMNTGVGRVSYSFMVQGQIDQILSSNPEERRVIFEEAAGITRYKIQRKETLSKLVLVEQNLDRVKDRIEEIQRQIASLKRQASKALRFKKLNHKLKHLDISINAKIFADKALELASLKDSFENAKNQIEIFKSTFENQEKNLFEKRNSRTALFEKIQTSQAGLYELGSQMQDAKSQAEFCKVRQDDLQIRIEQTNKAINSIKEQLETLGSKKDDDESIRQEHLELVRNSDEIFKQKNAELEELQANLSEFEAKFSNLKQDKLFMESALTRARSQMTSLEVDSRTFQSKHTDLNNSILQINEESLLLEAKLSQLDESVFSINMQKEEISVNLSEYLEASNTLKARYKQTQIQIQDFDRLIAKLSAKFNILQNLQNKFEGFSEGTKAILQGKVQTNTPAITIASFLSFKEENAKEVGLIMSSLESTIALSDPNEAIFILEELKNNKLGKASIKTSVKSSFTQNQNTLPEFLIKTSSIVSLLENAPSQLIPLFNDLIENTFIANSLSEFLKFLQENPDFSFLLVATKDGSIIDSKGVIFGGFGQLNESSIFERNLEIKRIKEELDLKNNSLTEATEQAIALQVQMDNNEALIEEKKSASIELERQISSVNAQKTQFLRQIETYKETLAQKKNQLENLDNELFETKDKFQRAENELAKIEQNIKENSLNNETLEEKLKSLRTLQNEKLNELSEIRIDLAQKKQVLESFLSGLKQIENQKKQFLDTIEKNEFEKASFQEQISQLQEQSKNQLGKASNILETIKVGENSLKDDKDNIALIEKEISDIELELNDKRKSLSEKEKVFSQVELSISSTNAKLDFIAKRILEEHDLEIQNQDWKKHFLISFQEIKTKIKLDELEEEQSSESKILAETNLEELSNEDIEKIQEPNWSIIEKEISSLKSRISSIGPVNLVAIEEYIGLKDRYDFLKAQSDDLWNSKTELVKAIDEINLTSKQMFQDTFERIKENFKFTFDKLFNGGFADLNLVETEDVLESGIEIIARPPGSKVKSLSLLSGGQRAMTAVGLLFAIYMVKPSPFCILDELDAPLDDVNVGRYTQILQDFTKYSQFLVITHNKRTVASGNAIYGVTMQERGITKLISMKFNHKANDQELENLSQNPI